VKTIVIPYSAQALFTCYHTDTRRRKKTIKCTASHYCSLRYSANNQHLQANQTPTSSSAMLPPGCAM
jgi:hypothetical protein